MSIKDEVNKLFKTQLSVWQFAKNQYESLKKVETKTLQLSENASVKVQFNPERIKSSSAKVDKKSIAERPCFLCSHNRPKVQEGIDFKNFTILVNPYPIFRKHLTIVHKEHRAQEILPFFSSMLELCKELPDYTIFYNGPKCGASAPDHFHLQAGIKNVLPIEKDFETGKCLKLEIENVDYKIFRWIGYRRSVISIQSHSINVLTDIFDRICGILKQLYKVNSSPMLNILAYFKNNNYIVHLFPRKLHRPACYFEKGEKQILLSPASVDMGGLLITPRKEDFLKIKASDVLSIFNQVCVPESDLNKIMKNLELSTSLFDDYCYS